MQLSCPHQVVRGSGAGNNPHHLKESAMFQLAQQSDVFQPAEALLDPLPLLQQQTVAVPGGGHHILHLLVQSQAHELAIDDAVIDLPDQTLRAQEAQHLQHLGVQQLLRDNRWSAAFGVHRLPQRRYISRKLVSRRSRGQRMIPPHSLPQPITEYHHADHRFHECFLHTQPCCGIEVTFQQPARASRRRIRKE